jgi:hypothetical protein
VTSGVGSTEPPKSGGAGFAGAGAGAAELLVFGRTEYAEPLTERGVAATRDDLLTGFPGPWVELVAFPRSAVHWIIRGGEEVGRERTARAPR